jgi:hypothetical protein
VLNTPSWPEGSGEVALPAPQGDMHEGQTLAHKPRVVTLDAQNRVLSAVEGFESLVSCRH